MRNNNKRDIRGNGVESWQGQYMGPAWVYIYIYIYCACLGIYIYIYIALARVYIYIYMYWASLGKNRVWQIAAPQMF